MRAVDLGVVTVDEVLRVVRALGSHRYVAGRLHLVHALGVASIGDDAGAALAEARTWASSVLGSDPIDPASRDPRLWRRCSDAELAAVLDGYWTPGDRSRRAREALLACLAKHDLSPRAQAPFDERIEDEIHPLTVDAGWELLALSQLDPERHRGAIAAFGSALSFESARFEEQTAIPPPSHLYELPAIGPVELLRGADERGELTEPFVVWAQGDETYLDYVLRGVKRAAKIA